MSKQFFGKRPHYKLQKIQTDMSESLLFQFELPLTKICVNSEIKNKNYVGTKSAEPFTRSGPNRMSRF